MRRVIKVGLHPNLDDGGEVVVHENNITRVLGDIRTSYAHGKAHIGSFESRSIIRAITCHRNHFWILADVDIIGKFAGFKLPKAAVFQTTHQDKFVLLDRGENVCVFTCAIYYDNIAKRAGAHGWWFLAEGFFER